MAAVKTVDCILLAAGASERLGRPKLLLPVGEKTVLELVLASHLASSVRRICAVVPGWLAGFREVTGDDRGGRLKVLELECPCVMSASLQAGWRWVRDAWHPDGVMISLADKPLVTTRTIDQMIAAFDASARQICVPVYGGRRGHPVVLDSRLGSEVLSLSGDRGAADVLSADPGRVEEVEVASDGVLLDIDTAEDVLEMRKRLGLE